MYIVGLLDDEKGQLATIRRTIKYNAPRNVQFDFINYDIPASKENAISEISEQVIRDICDEKITALIIDYKIMVEALKVQGTDILQRVNDVVPKCPVIILTERVDESISSSNVDADKVYKKADFFKIEEEYSKEKVAHIFDSMQKYVRQRDELTVALNDLKGKLSKGDRSVIEAVLKIEARLDAFVPIEQTQMDRIYDTQRLQKVVDLINEANKLME